MSTYVFCKKHKKAVQVPNRTAQQQERETGRESDPLPVFTSKHCLSTADEGRFGEPLRRKREPPDE